MRARLSFAGTPMEILEVLSVSGKRVMNFDIV